MNDTIANLIIKNINYTVHLSAGDTTSNRTIDASALFWIIQGFYATSLSGVSSVSSAIFIIPNGMSNVRLQNGSGTDTWALSTTDKSIKLSSSYNLYSIIATGVVNT